MTITTTCPDPSTVNPLYNNGFILSLTAIPSLSLFCKEFTMPNVTLNPAEQATPYIKFPKPGDHLEFSSFTVTCNCDEQMNNYQQLYRWMRLVGFKNDITQVNQWRELQGDKMHHTCDEDTITVCKATVWIRGANQTNIAAIEFSDVWLTDLSGLSFTEETTESTVVSFQATFLFRDFDFVNDAL